MLTHTHTVNIDNIPYKTNRGRGIISHKKWHTSSPTPFSCHLVKTKWAVFGVELITGVLRNSRCIGCVTPCIYTKLTAGWLQTLERATELQVVPQVYSGSPGVGKGSPLRVVSTLVRIHTSQLRFPRQRQVIADQRRRSGSEEETATGRRDSSIDNGDAFQINFCFTKWIFIWYEFSLFWGRFCDSYKDIIILFIL